MNIKTIISIILGILLLNNSLYTLISLPGIITLITLIGAVILLFMDGTKGGIVGKISFVFAIIIGVYALVTILNTIGISLPFISIIYGAQRLALIVGGILLIINPFVNG